MDTAPAATAPGGLFHRLRASDPKPDEILVLAFLLALIGFTSLFAESPGLEPLHNSRLTLMTLLVMVAALPAMIVPGMHPRGPLVAVRAWLPLLLGLLCYENLKHLHANNITLALGIEPRDAFMLRLDEFLFGAAVPLYLEGLIRPALTSYLQMAYTWFYYTMPVAVLITFYVRASLESFLAVRKALIYCLLGGYVTYLLVPVAGPLFLIGDQFTVPLGTHGPLMTLAFDTLRYNWDCFPSLHTAVPVLLTLLAWRHVSIPLRAMLVFATGSIVFSTLYLRLHYGIDIVAGFAWALLINALVRHEVGGYTVRGPDSRGMSATAGEPTRAFSAPVARCFVITGACALVIEQVFEKILSTIVGSTSTSAALVLAVYFAGLAGGAATYRLLAPRILRPLRFYAVMEFLVGAWALLAALNFPTLQRVSAIAYVELTDFTGAIAAKLLCASAWILLPTFVMGLSFPALTHFLKNRYGDTPRCQSEVNAFYGFNLLGAALAAFAAPYCVFPYAGLDRSLIGCFALECCVLIIALRVSARVETDPSPREATPIAHERLPRDAFALIALAFLCGFLFFGLEVLWVHLSATVIGTSVYAFANTLLAVLVGLYFGNRLVWRLSWPDREMTQERYQQLISCCLVVLLVTFVLWDDVPRIFLMTGPYVAGFHSGEFVRLALLFVLVAIPAMFVGALFPGLFRMAAFRQAGTVRMVSLASAANALGCISGAAIAGLLLLPTVGSENLFKLLITLLALGLAGFSWRYLAAQARHQLYASTLAVGCVALLLALPWDYRELTAGYNVYFDVRSVRPGSVIRYLHESPAGGITSVVDNAARAGDGSIVSNRTLLTNGKFQGNDAWEVPAQIGFALIPILHTRARDRALVIGLGTGQTANVVRQFGFAKIDIAELSPGVANAAAGFFGHINDGVLEDVNVTLHADDGRHFLLQADARFNLITIEISSMWFNGATNLYSTDFFALAAAKLTSGGVLQQWLQIHHLSPREIGSVIASVSAVFPYVEFWVHGGQGIIVASREPLRLSADLIRRAATVPVISRLDEQFVDRVLGSRLLDSAGVRRLAEAVSHAGIVTNNDSNRAMEFWSPRYNLDRRDYPRLNLEYLGRFREVQAVPP